MKTLPPNAVPYSRESVPPQSETARQTGATVGATLSYDGATVRREMLMEFYASREPGLIGQVVQTGNGFTVRRSNLLFVRKLAKHLVWPVELP